MEMTFYTIQNAKYKRRKKESKTTTMKTEFSIYPRLLVVDKKRLLWQECQKSLQIAFFWHDMSNRQFTFCLSVFRTSLRWKDTGGSEHINCSPHYYFFMWIDYFEASGGRMGLKVACMFYKASCWLCARYIYHP